MKETKALGDKTLAQSQKITLFAVLCPGDGFAGSALPYPQRFTPFGGGSSRQATFLGGFYEPMPNQLIVVTHTGGSRVKIGSSWRYGFDSDGERKMSCDQTLPSNHYSHWLF